ncbi:serine endopeptidase [Xenophilus sp. Marseille-Q4582]|uniref:serine endopeptidase n=1 Tax=Xenophilus sp. Marseille-Q4582 TaxID=2866600 RepID=UPI001CE3C746|nr:serine endopeptidase [Xenophilus sp. Marseille-Q4582]
MSKSLRLSEKWFRRGLWGVAFVFAGFLIGLGGTLVGDLPRVERPLELSQFMPAGEGERLRDQIEQADADLDRARREIDQARLALDAAEQSSRNARETFSNWLSTRRATQLPAQDTELIQRTQALDALKAAEAQAQEKLTALRRQRLDRSQAREKAVEQLQALEAVAAESLQAEQRRVELRVFLYRLALTLPLLALAGWLFAKKRQSPWWPFVWGFIFFALFAFFVELVPYLPSYGGYVRYLVGLLITALVGRYAIVGLQRYLARQKEAEAHSAEQRREALGYDTALARLAKGVCPGCERPVDLKAAAAGQATGGALNFCPHCGIGLFDHCGRCHARKSAFSRFCPDCGSPAQAGPADAPPAARGPMAPAR